MIALINPPNPPGRISNKDMMGGFGQCYPEECGVRVPPLDLPYVAAVLRDSNIKASIFDCLGSDLSADGLVEGLKREKIDMVFIRTSTSTFEWDTSVSERIKKEINAAAVFFGPHVNVAPEEIIANPNVDALILGEPEYTVREIAEKGLGDIPGLWYKKDGEIVRNTRKITIDDLDKLPFPAWDLFPYTRYTVGSIMPAASPTLFMLTSRGCPFSCSYCPYPVAQGTKYRKRSARNVLDEFRYLSERFNVKNLVIRDAEFTLDRKRVEDICNGLIASGNKISWRCETRVDTLDEELVELMHRAGCIGINMGIESNSEKVCKNVGRKPLDAGHTKNIIRKCRELGIHTFCFFIIGLPGDDVKSVLDTIKYSVNLGADISQFTVATPYLGTGLKKWAEANNYITALELKGVTGFEAMMRNEALTAEQIMGFRNLGQRLLDLKQIGEITGAGEELKDDRSMIASAICLLFYLFHFFSKKPVIVYGTKGVNIPLLKKLGFDVAAVVDEKTEGKISNNLIVLHPMLIYHMRSCAVLISPYKGFAVMKAILRRALRTIGL